MYQQSLRHQGMNVTLLTFSSNCWGFWDELTTFFCPSTNGLGDPSRLGRKADSDTGEFLDEPLSLVLLCISSFHWRRNDASSSSSLPSSQKKSVTVKKKVNLAKCMTTGRTLCVLSTYTSMTCQVSHHTVQCLPSNLAQGLTNNA